MSSKNIYLILVLVIALFSTWFFSETNTDNKEFSDNAKTSIREIGHQLLLTNQDSTSLVLPVIELEVSSKYALSFKQQLKFMPNDLVKIVKESFIKAKLPEHYRVSVIQKNDNEVAYSYEMSADEESTIIPCSGRYLPKSHYTIEVNFIGKSTSLFDGNILLYVFIFIVFFLLQFVLYKRKQAVKLEEANTKHASIGSFVFYPEQNRLVKERIEIALSQKECELLSIFISNINQVVRREELTKKVWEDKGVIVGRSLDTYISKLRKKLKDDDSIKLTNVHGVGYKLEVV